MTNSADSTDKGKHPTVFEHRVLGEAVTVEGPEQVVGSTTLYVNGKLKLVPVSILDTKPL